MANKITTVFQNLEKTVGGMWGNTSQVKTVNRYDMSNVNTVLYKTDNKEDYEKKKLELRQQNYLNNMWVNTNRNLTNNSLNGLSAIKLMYRDVEVMDSYPEVGAALDLYADEACLVGSTKVRLLNGQEKTIEELYNEGYSNFWTYSVDKNGHCKPTLVERIINKGEREVCLIRLDDGTEITCTLNHKLMLSDKSFVEAKDLKIGYSLMSIYDKLDGKGYEKIISTCEGKYSYTHKIVADNVLNEEKEDLLRKGSDVEGDRIIVHHKSFNKLNNDPSELEFMYWSKHSELHYKLNSERWNNKEYADKMRSIFIRESNKFWHETDKEKLNEYVNKRAESLRKFVNTMSEEERKAFYGRNGERNYFYNKRSLGKENHRYNFNKTHASDIDLSDYVQYVISYLNNNKGDCQLIDNVEKHYNIVRKEIAKLNKQVYDKFNISKIKDLQYTYANQSLFDRLKYLCTLNKSFKEISKELNITKFRLSKLINSFGYKRFNDLKSSLKNHRVVAIELLNKKEVVYDFVNSSCNDCFAIKCNKGFVISHNCTVNSKGEIVNVYSNSNRIKSIIEDLLVNRLDIQVTAPMVIRALCKYGNQFMMLNLNNSQGVLGWRQLPCPEIERIEDGLLNPYASTYSNSTTYSSSNLSNNSESSTKFLWVGGNNENNLFRTWQIAHFRLLTDSVFLPYGCIVEDSRIETEFGYKEIKDIEIGDKVYTFNVDSRKRELSTVTMMMNKGEKDVYKLSTKHTSIEATNDHKFLTLSNKDKNKLEYKELKDIKVGDYIVIRKSSKEECVDNIKVDKSFIKDNEIVGRHKNFNWWNEDIKYIPNYIDEDFARFFGFMVGDGWISKNRVFFALGEYDSLNYKYMNYIEKITNKKTFLLETSSKGNKLPYNACFVYSYTLAIILKRLGFNGKSKEKRIPQWVFESNKKIKEAFLDGLVDADGTYKFVGNKLYYNIELTNEELVKDIKVLIQSLNYRGGNVHERVRKINLSRDKEIYSYYLNFSKEELTQVKRVSFDESSSSDVIVEKVKEIKYVGVKTTYDITVENKNSNFFANGIVTHNCSILHKARRHFRMLSLMEDMMLLYRLDRSIERRIYKIYVGAIDDADVQSYVQEIANNIKRTPIVDPMTGQLDLRKNILPVHKDTPIPLLDGRTISIEELAKEYEEGKDNYVYSVQDGTMNIAPGRVVWCGKNYTADNLVKITLDDDTYVIMAKEHEIIMRDGSKKRADEISVGESIMPFYTDLKRYKRKNGSVIRYETVYNPRSGRYEFTHDLVGKFLNKKNGIKLELHHKDIGNINNKFNNSPNNLVWLDSLEHKAIHNEFNEAHNLISTHVDGMHLCTNESVEELNYMNIDEFFFKELWKVMGDGTAFNNIENFDYLNENIIDHLFELCKSYKIDNYSATYRYILRDYIEDLGLKNAVDYIRYLFEKNGYGSFIDNIINLKKNTNTYKAIPKVYGYGEKARIKNYVAKSRKVEVKVKSFIPFDDFVWDEIRNGILKNGINTRAELLDYINNNENIINYLVENNPHSILTDTKKISYGLLTNRVLEKYGCGVCDFIAKMKKNHKVKKVEIISGDDVYCMTVEGINGEQDRHNFAICSWNGDKTYSRNGIFVSNCQDNDLFIPTRNENAPSPVETLPAAQNLTAIDDIKFVQNKVLAGLRIPKPFLNFEEATGDGKNLALMDVRFARVITRIQQAFLMELTKVVTIHLFLLGFKDDLTNFTLTMNNPSTQAEQLEIENLQKKIDAVRNAVSDPGNGIPTMSMTRAWKEIMKYNDEEIKEILEEIRLEKALAAELEKTSQIIKRTNIFDTVDKVYGEPGAEYQEDDQANGGMDNDGGLGGGMNGGGGGFGDGLDGLGEPGTENATGDINGEESTTDTAEMPMDNSNSGTNNNSSSTNNGNLNQEGMNKPKKDNLLLEYFFDKYIEHINKKINYERTPYEDESFVINEDYDKILKGLNKFVD